MCPSARVPVLIQTKKLATRTMSYLPELCYFLKSDVFRIDFRGLPDGRITVFDGTVSHSKESAQNQDALTVTF